MVTPNAPNPPASLPFKIRVSPDTSSASGLGTEIHGLDPERFDAEQAAALRALVYEHKVLVMRGLALDDEAYIAFARALGEPQIYFQENYHHPQHPEIFVSSNVPMDGKKVGVAGTGAYWHTDYQFFPEPLPMTMVAPRAIPSGSRGTCYVDMEHALERLPADLSRRIEGKRALHEAKWRYKVQPCDVDKSITQLLDEFGALTPTVSHPIVMTHPVNGRRLLYVSRGFTVGIEGMSHEEGKALLAELFDEVEREEFVFTHPWTIGDVLLWDNRQVIHMARGGAPDEPSVSYRIGVYDGLSFCADEPRGRLAQ